MTIVYRFLSDVGNGLFASNTRNRRDTSSSQSGFLLDDVSEKFSPLIPSTRISQLDEMKACRVQSGNIFLSTLFVVLHEEATYCLRGAMMEYRESGRLDFLSSLMDEDRVGSWFSWRAWESYWRHNLKDRVLPAWAEYHATILVMKFYQAVVSLFVSPEIFLRMTQNPYHRALALASAPATMALRADPLVLGADIWAVNLWSNLLFFCANITVTQAVLYYGYHNRWHLTGDQTPPQNTEVDNDRDHHNITPEDSNAIIGRASWRVCYTKSRQFFFSAIGAGVGSMIWPGWGTLIGIGIGDTYGESLPVPQQPRLPPPTLLLRNLLNSLQPQNFNQEDQVKSNSERIDDKDREGPFPWRHNKNDRKKLYDIEARMCGCCQIVAFSANPNSRDLAPISSRTCGHSICRSCVTKCHLMLMERRCTYVEWIKCPLCNSGDAFSSHDHIVNRSLCEILAWLDDEAM